MRVRKLAPDGDYRFGRGRDDFEVNTPDAVAILASERLRLWLAEWFLDTSDGTPYREQVLGRNTEATRDPVLRYRLLDTPGVTELATYDSVLNRDTRKFEVSATLVTAYGAASITTALGSA